MNESTDGGQGLASSSFVDPTEGPCINESTIGEDQASSKSESSFQEPSVFPQPNTACAYRKIRYEAIYEATFWGADSEKLPRDSTEN